ncbi:MAG: hypothetical protein R3C99_26970 [Pirellulaceae bacterium]
MCSRPLVNYCSAAGGPAITDPKEAGIDYAIQGEYSGTIKTSDGEETWGGKVVALGDSRSI